MAIIKSIVTKFGVNAEYHRISSMYYSSSEDVLEVTVETYINAAAREAGADPLSASKIRVAGSDLDTTLREAVYPLLIKKWGSTLAGGKQDQGGSDSVLGLKEEAQIDPRLGQDIPEPTLGSGNKTPIADL